MGSTFVTLGRNARGIPVDSGDDAEVGFWMSDSMLQLWLRFLALHIDEPTPENQLAATIRNQWLLASRHGFGGCVPHDLDEATATPEGFELVNRAVESLSAALDFTSEPIAFQTLNLMGFDGPWSATVDVDDLRDIAAAFRDLLDFKVESTASTKRPYPGSRNKSPLH
jgi:hypothetical protein